MKDTKSIQLNSTLHTELKIHCVGKGIVMQKLVEKLIRDELSKSVRSDSTKSKDRE